MDAKKKDQEEMAFSANHQTLSSGMEYVRSLQSGGTYTHQFLPNYGLTENG